MENYQVTGNHPTLAIYPVLLSIRQFEYLIPLKYKISSKPIFKHYTSHDHFNLILVIHNNIQVIMHSISGGNILNGGIMVKPPTQASAHHSIL